MVRAISLRQFSEKIPEGGPFVGWITTLERSYATGLGKRSEDVLRGRHASLQVATDRAQGPRHAARSFVGEPQHKGNAHRSTTGRPRHPGAKARNLRV